MSVTTYCFEKKTAADALTDIGARLQTTPSSGTPSRASM
jgi:hypothetical protein